MSVVIASITNVDSTRDSFVVYGKITLSGTAGATGDTLSFAGFDLIKSSSPPMWVDIMEIVPAASVSSTAPSGLIYRFAPGTTQANGLFLAYSTGGGTPTGTIVTTLTTVTNASTAAAIYTTGGALTQIAGATGITGPVSTFTGTGSAGGGGLIGAVTWASVHAANVQFRAIFNKFI